MQIMAPLHILAFGNSITAGWTDGGSIYHPYAGKLVELLEKSLPLTNITIDVQGAPGDQVVSPPGGYVPRIDILYEETTIPYDWAIILGGTNDLNQNRPACDIWTYLQKTYAFPLHNGTKVLALTVPEQGEINDDRDEQRDELNNDILNHKVKNFYTFDLNKAFPYWSLNNSERKKYWADSTHPTELGYDLIGRLLAKRLFQLISGEKRIEDVVQTPLRTDLGAKPNEKIPPKNELKARETPAQKNTVRSTLRSGRDFRHNAHNAQ